jgi:hypothetical protein
VFFEVAPDRGEGRCTGGRRAGQHALLLTKPDEVDKIFDFDQPIRRYCLDLLDEGSGIGRHGRGSCVAITRRGLAGFCWIGAL